MKVSIDRLDDDFDRTIDKRTTPASALLSVLVLVVGAAVGVREPAEQAVRRQMAVVYPLAAVLFLTRCLATNCVVVTDAF